MADVEENKPEPDLDELLELFREPEEEPRRKKGSGAIWLIAALILSLVGGWMAALVANRPAAKHSAPGPPVLPTKVSDRKPQEGQAGTVAVVKDYIARCQKGMTEREVRWVIEDFQKAGLAQGVRGASSEEFIRQRKAQHAWYLDLLADGLRLNPEQRGAAREKLAGLLEEAVAGFQKDLSEQASEPIEQDGRRLQLVSAEVITKLIHADKWLTDERYAPWELCDLTEQQLGVTWRPILTGMKNDGMEGEAGGWLDVPATPVIFEEGKAPVIPDSLFPAGYREFTAHLKDAGSVFPVAAVSLPAGPVHEPPLMKELRGYHPSQLKTLLLLQPELAEEVIAEPEKAGE